MNSETTAFLKHLARDVQGHGGLQGFRRHVLNNLKLKTVIKESHCSPIHQLCFNLSQLDCRNLFATVGKDQATVYDDLHMGDYIGVVANYAVNESGEEPSQEFLACTWLSSKGWTQHPEGDAYVAIGGTDDTISIISVVEAKVIRQLSGSHAEVTELSAADDQPGLLLSSSKDGVVRLWSVMDEECLATVPADAFAAALHPSGHYFLSCTRTGKLYKWQLTHQPIDGAPSSASSAPYQLKEDISKELLRLPGHEGATIDCMRFINADRLVTKTHDGRMHVYDTNSWEAVAHWRVPGCSQAAASYSGRCSFGHTRDGNFICVGNSKGSTFVFDATTGCQVCRADAIRVEGPVRSCGLSEDCRHLLAVVGNGFIFRFEYRSQELAGAAAVSNKTAAIHNADDMDTEPINSRDQHVENADQSASTQQGQQGALGQDVGILTSNADQSADVPASGPLEGGYRHKWT
eukprot:jgi/Chrzof1/8956/Cz03g30180.t1